MSKQTNTAAQLPDDENQNDAVKAPKRARKPQRKPRPIVPPAEKLLLTAAEVSALTGLHETVIYKMANMGTLPCLRLGRSVRFGRKAIEKWIEDNQRGGEV